ncbi:MAG: hypothetical protein D6689_04715 [Deltaproteobacteria bacterium]|nr:MAG: hypothetical protein D6689_04715 [Deltaproteobacteria bacterium]
MDDAEKLRACVAGATLVEADVMIRFDVQSTSKVLNASSPRLTEAPHEIRRCLEGALSSRYEAEAADGERFLPDYSGALDLFVRIRASVE